MRKLIRVIPLLLFVAVFITSCSVYNAITNAQRLQFKLGKVTNMSIEGIDITSKNNISDFSAVDALKLVNGFSGNHLNTSFVLNVLAKNPNDGTGGTTATSALIKNLAWRLFMDEKEMINGNVANIEVPGVGQETNIPVAMSFNLIDYLKGDSYDKIIGLALGVGGKSGSSTRIQLKVVPTVETFLGPITYPGELTVVDKEFK